MDQLIINNIKQYVFDNNISIMKLSEASKIPYHRLWLILNRNAKVSVGDYVAICLAFNEPLEFFIPNLNVKPIQ